MTQEISTDSAIQNLISTVRQNYGKNIQKFFVALVPTTSIVLHIALFVDPY